MEEWVWLFDISLSCLLCIALGWVVWNRSFEVFKYLDVEMEWKRKRGNGNGKESIHIHFLSMHVI